MRKYLIIFLAVALAGCGSPNQCNFSKVHISITEVGTGKLINDFEFKDCFKATMPDPMGMVDIKGDKTAEKFHVTYFQEVDSHQLAMLNVKVGNQLTEWRRSKGNDLFISGLPSNDTLTFVFGDRVKAKVKGTITFSK